MSTDQIFDRVPGGEGFMSEAKVDGKYTPSTRELKGIFEKIDLVKKFEKANFRGRGKDDLSIKFGSLSESRLFTLFLFSHGIDSEFIGIGPSDTFFDPEPLTDCRVDPFFCVDETMEEGEVTSRIYLRNVELIDGKDKEKYTSWIKGAIEKAIPHIKEQVEDFKFE